MNLEKPKRVIDPKFRRWVKAQDCFARWPLTVRVLGVDLGNCDGPMDPHHAKEKGFGATGSKPSDRDCIPACRSHHEMAESNPALFRELFAAMKYRLNSDYDVLCPAKPRRERKRAMKVKLDIQFCAGCGREHKITGTKLIPGKPVTFRCINSGKVVEVA